MTTAAHRGATLLLVSAGIMLALTIVRLLGLARDMIIAARFGAGAETDVILFIVDLSTYLGALLGVGGLSAALVVAYGANPERARALFVQSTALIAVLFGVVAITLSLAAPLFTTLLAPGFDATTRAASHQALPYAMVSLAFLGLLWPAAALEQHQGRFFVAALSGGAVNVAIIAAMLFAPIREGVLWAGVAVAVGAALRWLMAAMRPMAQLKLADFAGPRLVGWRTFGSLSAAAAAEATQVVYPLALRSFASLYGAGALSAAAFAVKLIFLPVYLLFASLGQVAFTRIAARAKNGDAASLADEAGAVIVSIAALAVLATPAAILFAEDAAALLFGWGEMTSDEVRRIALLTAFFAPAILPMAIAAFVRPLLGARVSFHAALRAELFGGAVFIGAASALLALEQPLALLMTTAALGQSAAFVWQFYRLRASGLRLDDAILRNGWALDLALVAVFGTALLALASFAPAPEGQTGSALRLGLGAASAALALASLMRMRPSLRRAMGALLER